MDPQSRFCPNMDCPARGETGAGTIVIHSRKEQRYKCKRCGRTFAATTGTAFYRLHHEVATMVLVLTLLAYGCPLQAIVVAFGLDERTVASWQRRAGTHCQQVHQHLVQPPRDLGHVQADELFVKQQGKRVWMGLALQVPTRLWLGGVVRAVRDSTMITHLMGVVRACALPRPLLIATDGLRSYVTASLKTFRTPVLTGKRGRPRLRLWEGLVIGQVVKQYAGRAVTGVQRRLIRGTPEMLRRLLTITPGQQVLNTAAIERLNATFRARLAPLARRTRALARQTATLEAGMYLVGTVYNFCTPHDSLWLPATTAGSPGRPRTPAMAAGLTDHCWSLHELFSYRVPPARWLPQQRPSRPPATTQQLFQPAAA